jgi:hypothetical protein
LLLLPLILLTLACLTTTTIAAVESPASTATRTARPAADQTPSPVPSARQATAIPAMCRHRGRLAQRAVLRARAACRWRSCARGGSGVEEESPSGRWVMITSPIQGWVNASYVCEGTNNDDQTD